MTGVGRTREARDFFGPGRLIEGAALINLDRRPERLQQAIRELRDHGLDGHVSRLAAYEHEHGMYGCSRSHVAVVCHARQQGWRSVLILEDDIKFASCFAEEAPQVLEDLEKRDWGVFQFGVMKPGVEAFVTPRLFQFRCGAGAHATLLHERTYDYLIGHYICEPDRGNWDAPKHYPFDEYVNNCLPQLFPTYGAARLLISQHAGRSDTWDQLVDYRTLLEDEYARLRVPPTQVSLGPRAVVVDWRRAEDGDLLHSLFGEACSSAQPPVAADLEIRSTGNSEVTLWQGAERVYAGERTEALGRRLSERIRRLAAGG